MDSPFLTQRILVAPLNWGLGHASRCVPLVRRELAAGHRVTLAGDGASLTLLRKHFPTLPVIHLPHLDIRYSKGKSQVMAMLFALPRLVWWTMCDHWTLRRILSYQHFDKIISDNRFGLYSSLRTPKPMQSRTRHIYVTHQLMVKMPNGLQWAEKMVHWLHGRIIGKYDECWIPDYAGADNLSGDLSHKYPQPRHARFIGPLSRFEKDSADSVVDVALRRKIVAVLSGVEPQRTMLEQELLAKYKDDDLLLVRGKMNESFCTLQRGKVTIVPYLPDTELAKALVGAEKIIARSGYSTIMDFDALDVLDKTEWIPTPGQTEQMYLSRWLKFNKNSDGFAHPKKK